MRGADFYLIPFSLFWLGIIIVGQYNAAAHPPKNQSTWFPLIFLVPFVLVGLHLVLGRFLIDAKMRANTEYALTNRRAIIVSKFFVRRIQSVNLQLNPETSVTEKADGSGTIVFGSSQPANWRPQGYSWVPGKPLQPAFEMIENVRKVSDIIDKVGRS